MMTRPARTLGALGALATAAVLLGGAVPVAVRSPARSAPAAVSAAGAAGADSLAAVRSRGDSLGPEWAQSDSFAPPQLYLAWHAPYGMPGATDTISFGAGDSNRVDTLYMSFETGRHVGRFLGMFARLTFHPAAGDSLGSYWNYDYGWPNYRNVEIQFDPDGTFPCPQPWIRAGAGFPDFTFDPTGARLELFYLNLNLPSVIPVDGTVRYCYARVMFRQRRWNLPGARQPVCIEWSRAVFSAGHEDAVARGGIGRSVSVNSPDGSVSAPYRRAPGPVPWSPNANPHLKR